MIPSYSEDAKAAIPALMNSAYKCFLFFEDSGAENFYEEIVKKLTPDFRDIRVICLSGKNSLIEHCQNTNNSTTKPKSLYILDQDFDFLLGKNLKDKSIIYLNRYSIENYLLEETAIILVIQEEKPRLKNIAQHLDWPRFFDINLPLLVDLCSMYLISQEFSLGIPSCSEPIQRFTKDTQPWLICADKVQKYRDEIESLLVLNGIAASEAELQSIFSDRRLKVSNVEQFPGKQLVDLARLNIGKKFDMRNVSRESLCFRLAKACTFNSLENLRGHINNIV